MKRAIRQHNINGYSIFKDNTNKGNFVKYDKYGLFIWYNNNIHFHDFLRITNYNIRDRNILYIL